MKKKNTPQNQPDKLKVSTMYLDLKINKATGRPNKDPRLKKYQRLLVLNKMPMDQELSHSELKKMSP